MIDRYLEGLGEALAAAGVRGRPARRLLTEARDHLLELSAEHGEEAAVERFGDAGAIAARVAAQLASSRTRAATYGAFAALAVTAAAYLAAFLLVDRAGGSPDLFGARHEALGVIAVTGLFLFPQVAFVCGCLALLRALRLRRHEAIPAADLVVMRSRAVVALLAGGLTAGSLGLFAVEFDGAPPLAQWHSGLVTGLAGGAAAVLAAAGIAVARSARPQALEAGPAGMVFDDLAPVFRMPPLRPLAGRPWLFAAAATLAVAGAAFAAGWIAEGGPVAGVVRAAAEAIAILAAFALLGHRLALR